MFLLGMMNDIKLILNKKGLYIFGSFLDLPVSVVCSQWCFPPTEGPLSVHAAFGPYSWAGCRRSVFQRK
jgi:hypothetical protein